MLRNGFCLILAALAVLSGFPARSEGVGTSGPIPLLIASPPCVDRRLGQVEVTLGTKVPNPKTAMPPRGVSYRQALDDLSEAAVERGGDAVILRHNEALYYNKGGRRARRPMYLSLRGAVVVLDEGKRRTCRLNYVDPEAFEREALRRTRNDILRDTRTDF